MRGRERDRLKGDNGGGINTEEMRGKIYEKTERRRERNDVRGGRARRR